MQNNDTCGARLRAGGFCPSTELGNGHRCRLHGGLSTGPKTLEGKIKSAMNIGKDYHELLVTKILRQMQSEGISTQYRARARKPEESSTRPRA